MVKVSLFYLKTPVFGRLDLRHLQYLLNSMNIILLRNTKASPINNALIRLSYEKVVFLFSQSLSESVNLMDIIKVQ